MSEIKCYLLVPTQRCTLHFRRYSQDARLRCPDAGHDYHNAMVSVGVYPEVKDDKGYNRHPWKPLDPSFVDPRWPTKCDACDYVFQPKDPKQEFTQTIYRRADTGDEFTLRDATPGAIYEAPWMSDHWSGTDGRSFYCRLPGGHDWFIDGRASNCTALCKTCGKQYADHFDKKTPCQNFVPLDGDKHRCWCRHGEAPNFTVDKNCTTCSAGAGSIISPNGWHGFLREGKLVL